LHSMPQSKSQQRLKELGDSSNFGPIALEEQDDSKVKKSGKGHSPGGLSINLQSDFGTSRQGDSINMMDQSNQTDNRNVEFIKLKIEIIDTGVGIKEENIDKLFMDFAKLDEHSMINKAGTGLGLSICKRMIEQMGG